MEPIWRTVSADDASRIAELDRAVKGVDGSEAISDLLAEVLSADAAVCACVPGGAIVAVGFVNGATLGGRVHPRRRRRGLGTRLLAWAEQQAPADEVEFTIRNEALTAGAHALYVSHGFERWLLEYRMVREVAAPLPEAPLPRGVMAVPWRSETAMLFFSAYRSSFADRPGFPDPPPEEWIADRGESFRPELSGVALAGEEPVGFVTVEVDSSGGWIDQIGVTHAWRRHGLGAGLLVDTVHRFQAEALADARLHVNANNQGAAVLFERLGFRKDLIRGRYVKRRH